MHIAYVLTCLEEHRGGVPRSTQGLANAVAKQGPSISFWSVASGNDRDALRETKLDSHVFEPAWPRGWFRSPGFSKVLRRHAEETDLFHIQELWAYPEVAAAKVANRTDTPYIIVPRGVLEPWRIRQKGYLKYLKKTAFLNLLGRSILDNSACLHAITPGEVDGFRQVGYQGPITVVPNGVDARVCDLSRDPSEAEECWPVLRNRRVVLFLSRLDTEKGLDQLLPAWVKLKERKGYEDALLVLAGPDYAGYQSKIDALIDQYDLESSILITGMVKGREKEALIARSDIYTLPSYSEGFSMSILENMAAGKPVLITPGCHFPEAVEAGAGICVEPESGQIEEGLKYLLDLSSEDHERMGMAGKKLVRENYTWDIAARKMITVYRCILEGKEIPLHPEPAVAEGNDL